MTIYSLDILLFQFWTSLLSMCSSNCCFLTCIQISQEAGEVVWYSHLFQNFPQFIVIHTVKGFGIVNESEVDKHLLLKFSYFSMIQWIWAIWSLVPLPFLKPAWTSGSSRFMYCWSLAWRILSITLLAWDEWDECNFVVVWPFFDITFLQEWKEKVTFSSPVATAEFSKFAGILRAALSQHHLWFEIAQLEFHHLP